MSSQSSNSLSILHSPFVLYYYQMTKEHLLRYETPNMLALTQHDVLLATLFCRIKRLMKLNDFNLNIAYVKTGNIHRECIFTQDAWISKREKKYIKLVWLVFLKRREWEPSFQCAITWKNSQVGNNYMSRSMCTYCAIVVLGGLLNCENWGRLLFCEKTF